MTMTLGLNSQRWAFAIVGFNVVLAKSVTSPLLSSMAPSIPEHDLHFINETE